MFLWGLGRPTGRGGDLGTQAVPGHPVWVRSAQRAWVGLGHLLVCLVCPGWRRKPIVANERELPGPRLDARPCRRGGFPDLVRTPDRAQILPAQRGWVAAHQRRHGRRRVATELGFGTGAKGEPEFRRAHRVGVKAPVHRQVGGDGSAGVVEQGSQEAVGHAAPHRELHQGLVARPPQVGHKATHGEFGALTPDAAPAQTDAGGGGFGGDPVGETGGDGRGDGASGQREEVHGFPQIPVQHNLRTPGALVPDFDLILGCRGEQGIEHRIFANLNVKADEGRKANGAACWAGDGLPIGPLQGHSGGGRSDGADYGQSWNTPLEWRQRGGRPTCVA